MDKYFSRGQREISPADGTAVRLFLWAFGTTSTPPPTPMAKAPRPSHGVTGGEALFSRSGFLTAAGCRSIGGKGPTQGIVLATGIDAAHGFNIRGQLVVIKFSPCFSLGDCGKARLIHGD